MGIISGGNFNSFQLARLIFRLPNEVDRFGRCVIIALIKKGGKLEKVY
tara:strand:+ start:343 stop:486 length:144 start_codon:yes stop_codon:yes gene_type:complete